MFCWRKWCWKININRLVNWNFVTNKRKYCVDINDTKNILPKYQNIIGIVPQKTRLINDSLLNNIILESDEKLKNEKDLTMHEICTIKKNN